ncbi:unnamed protein product, partial [Porites evermanni]
KTIHYPALPAKTLCSIPSTHLQGVRNYIATILKSYLRGMSIISLGLLCAFCMSCYVLYRQFVLLFSFTHCWRHSVASVFHCEDFSFMGVNCWIHPIFYGANYSSH